MQSHPATSPATAPVAPEPPRSMLDRIRLRLSARLVRNLLRKTPGDAKLYFQLADVESLLGNLAEASRLYQLGLRLDGRQPEALVKRGVLLEQLGNNDDAVACYNRALELKPGMAEASQRRAALLKIEPDSIAPADRKAGKASKADENLERGYRFFMAGAFQEALAQFDLAIKRKPDLATAHLNRGAALFHLNRYEEAVESYRTALAMEEDPRTLRNLSVALGAVNRPDEALQYARRMIEIDPRDPTGPLQEAALLMHQGHWDEAAAGFERALALEPNHVGANWNKSLLLLLRGEYKEGWRLAEYRWQLPEMPASVRYPQPQWRGDFPIKGKIVLVELEQGQGDFLQFIRYIPLMEKMGARVVMRVPDNLLGIAETVSRKLRVLRHYDALPEFDAWCYLMSLPLAFGTTLETIPASVPYLHADAGKSRDWKRKLAEAAGLRVGLVWAGGFRPGQPHTWLTNQKRNIPLEKLAPLKMPGVTFYSLQLGSDSSAQLGELKARNWEGPDIIDLTPDLKDFTDTAAFVDNLDLVITVDTSVAHLAGAMGKPVWLLNRYDTDWRWFLDRETSPWYPNTTVLRQPSLGDWDGVVALAAERLRAKLAQAR